MPIWEEADIEIVPSGIAQLRVDRVRLDSGSEARRLKVTRRSVESKILFPDQDAAKTHILPPNCRFYYPPWIVIEEPPCVRTVTWTHLHNGTDWESVKSRGLLRKYGLDPKEDATRTRFRLAFPYTIFLLPIKPTENKFTLGTCTAAFRSEPLRSLEDELFWSAFTNQRSDTGELCLGRHQPNLNNTLHGMAEALITHWWNSNFIDHWFERYDIYTKRIPQLITPWDWEYHSRKGPAWTCEADWISMGMTLGEKIGIKRDQRAAQNTLTFDELSRRAKAAKEYVPEVKKPEVTKIDVVEKEKTKARSRDVEQIFDRKLIRVGDHFKYTGYRIRRAFKSGETYELSRIMVREFGGYLFYFKDIVTSTDEYYFWQDFSHCQFTNKPPVKLGDIEIGVRTYFVLTDTTDIPGLNLDTKYQITDIEKDAEGDVRVKLNTDDWIYITYDGGKILPSIKVLIPKLADDTFTYGQLCVRVGMVVQVGERKRQILKIASLTQKENVYFVTFEDQAKEIILFDHDLWLTLHVTPYEFDERRVLLGDKVLDLSQGCHLLVVKKNLALRYGALYEMQSLVRSEQQGAHPLDVDLLIRHGNESIPVIRHSLWVFPDGYEQATNIYQDDSLTLHAGEKLICKVTGKEQTILCFDKLADNRPEMKIVFTDGHFVLLSQDGLRAFQKKDGQEFTRSEVKRLGTGNNTSGTRFSLHQQQELPTNIPPNLAAAIADRTSLKGYGDPVGEDRMGTMMRVGDVVKILRIEERSGGNGHLHVHAVNTHALVVHHCLSNLEVYLYLGANACNGDPNLIPETRNWNSLDSRYQADTKTGQMALSYTNRLQRIDIEPTITKTSAQVTLGTLVRIRRDITPQYGRGNVGSEEMGILQSITENEVCVVFPSDPEWIGLITEVESCPFEQGHRVMLDPKFPPRFLHGRVQQGQVGVITEFLDDGTLLINFPDHQEWHGDLLDLLPAQTR